MERPITILDHACYILTVGQVIDGAQLFITQANCSQTRWGQTSMSGRNKTEQRCLPACVTVSHIKLVGARALTSEIGS